MIFFVEINNRTSKIDLENPIDVSIPLDFRGAQPNAYGVERATATAYETGNLIGDTRRGGSCNFEQINFVPHCNGTHTECVGHITHERIAVHDCLKDSFVGATLISVEPENAIETIETYSVNLNKTDKLLTQKTLEKALENVKSEIRNLKFDSLIVRTLPNDKSKLKKTYLDEIPPFFSLEAMRFIGQIGVKHLLVDLPSIDRIFDEGKLSNHRIFWNVEPEKFESNENTLINNTITEMIFVPNEIKDGAYLLNLQIASFASDASPSRPRLFKILPP